MQSLKDFLASVHYLNHPIISGLGTLALLVMGIFVLTRNPKSELYRIFFLLMSVIAVWFGGNTLCMLYYRNIDLAIFWFKIGYSGVCFMTAVYYHFYLVQTKKTERNFLYLLYFIGILELIFLWSFSGLKNGASALLNVGVIWQGMPRVSYFLAFGMVKYIIVTLLIAKSLFNEYKKSSGPEKKRFQWLTVFFFAFTLGSIEWAVVFGIPLHIGWLAVPLALFPISYAIVKHQLMDIKIVIKKAFIYSIIIGLISGIFVGVSFLSNWFVENIPGFQIWIIPLIVATTTFLIGYLFWQKSKEADKLKYEFITVATHKLRVPLTRIKWAAANLRETKTDKDRDRLNRLIEEINNDNECLIALTNELLSASKAEEDSYLPKLSIVDLGEIIRKILRIFQNRIDDRKIKITLSIEDDLPKVNANKEQIDSVLQVLLENAITYSSVGGVIEISLKRQKDSLVFSIRDFGIGIRKEDQTYIFSKFFRAHNAMLKETEGTGLGLFLAQNTIVRHGGKIGFKSEGENKGSRFWFSLPVAF